MEENILRVKKRHDTLHTAFGQKISETTQVNDFEVMGKQCKNVCVTNGEHKPLQKMVPSKEVTPPGKIRGGISKGGRGGYHRTQDRPRGAL